MRTGRVDRDALDSIRSREIPSTRMEKLESPGNRLVFRWQERDRENEWNDTVFREKTNETTVTHRTEEKEREREFLGAR